MSSWGIRMELIWITMHAPCHQGERSLHLAHADGPPCDAQHSSFHPGEEFCPADIPLSPDISHPDGRGGRFNFLGQTCQDPLIGWRASTADNSDVKSFQKYYHQGTFLIL